MLTSFIEFVYKFFFSVREPKKEKQDKYIELIFSLSFFLLIFSQKNNIYVCARWREVNSESEIEIEICLKVC